MNKKGLLSIVIALIIAAVCTSGLMRAALELSIFLLLVGYLFIIKKKKIN